MTRLAALFASARDRHPSLWLPADPPRSGRASPSVWTFFALERQPKALLGQRAPDPRRAGEPNRFEEFWHELTGSDPRWLHIDSKVMAYSELSRLNLPASIS